MGELNGTVPDETQASPNPGMILVAGPSGCGKTTLGKLLAQELGWDFVDADDWHSPAAIQKMQAGKSLTDEDRHPWLLQLHSLGLNYQIRKQGWVLACSALRWQYRQWLWDGLQPAPIALWLQVSPQELERRLLTRQNHFFHPGLLSSQLSTQEVTEELKILDGEARLEILVPLIRALLQNRLS